MRRKGNWAEGSRGCGMKNDLTCLANLDVDTLCNFNIRILGRIDLIGDNNYIEHLLCLEVQFRDGSKRNIEIPLSTLERIKWSELDPRCIVFSNDRYVAKQLANIIRSQLTDDIPREVQLGINSVGLNHYNGLICFVTGGETIVSSLDNIFPACRFNDIPFRLDYDDKLSSIDAFKGVAEIVSLCPGVGMILLDYAISGIIREAFVTTGFIPEAVLMVVGKSGMLKSNYVPQITQIYNRNEGVRANTRFNSSKRFIEDTLSMYRHCTVVIDDLHTASSPSIKRQNEATAEEIIRRISDNVGRGRKNGNKSVQQCFEGNAVFIGEYTVGVESTVPRVLVVEITEKPDGEILDKYQRLQPLLVSTFYRYFIQWYVDNFEVICETINDRLSQFRSSDVLPWVHGRLRDTWFCFQVSHMILLEYCLENGFMGEDIALESYINFEQYITNLIIAQQNRYCQQDNPSTELNYLNIIKELYHSGAFRLAKNQNEFDPNKHDGVIHYKCLCLRGKSIDRIVGQKYESFSRNLLIDFLISKSALKRQGDKNTVQIKGGKRLYAIWLDKLEEAAETFG